jgi:transcriptional accessory protein Tex/SPT6
VVDFGAFVDIGVHQDGLVARLRDRGPVISSHPGEALQVGDTVRVVVHGGG